MNSRRTKICGDTDQLVAVIPRKAIFSIFTPPISFDRTILELYLFHPHVSVIFKILIDKILMIMFASKVRPPTRARFALQPLSNWEAFGQDQGSKHTSKSVLCVNKQQKM